MTTLSPNDSAIPPDQGETATVTISKIVGPDQVVIGEVTYHKTLTADGTSAPNIALRLRDGLTPVDDNVQSTSLGRWFSTFTLSKFKRYSLSIIEKNPPGDFSYPPKTFVLATATPLIATVTGKDGPIENGGSYNGDSLEFTGNAPPGVEVEAFDDGNTLGNTAPVDRDGLFKITLDGLVRKIYKFTFKAPDGKESEIFTVIVGEETATTIDDVQDDEGNSVPDGKSTIENNLTVSGTAEAGATVTLSGGVPTPVEFDADENGDWTYRFAGLTPNTYSLTADSEGIRLAPTEPRTFTVEAAAVVTLVNVTDAADNVIPEDSTTAQNSLFVNCTGEKGKEIEAFDGPTSLGKEVVGVDGTRKIAIGPLTDKVYAVKVRGNYTGGGESRTYPFTVKTPTQSEITLAIGENNQKIENGGSTQSKWLIIRGKTVAGQMTKLLGAPVPPQDDTADAEGVCVYFLSPLSPATYSFTIQKSDGSTPASQAYVVTVSA